MARSRLADVIFQRDDRLAGNRRQPLRRTGQHRIRGPLVAQDHAHRLEGLVGSQRIQRLLPVHRHLAARNLQRDFARHQQRGHQIAQRVRRPAKGRVGKHIREPLAVHRSIAVDVVADTDQRLGVGANGWRAAGHLHQRQRVQRRGHRLEVARTQKLLCQRGLHAHGRLTVAVVHLGRDLAEIALGRIEQVGGEGFHRRLPAPKEERALAELTPKQALQLAFEPVGAGLLGAAVILHLFVGVVAVLLMNPLAAENIGRQRLGLGRNPPQQEDRVLGRPLA